jgi:hypothetical protein
MFNERPRELHLVATPSRSHLVPTLCNSVDGTSKRRISFFDNFAKSLVDLLLLSRCRMLHTWILILLGDLNAELFEHNLLKLLQRLL